MSKLGRRLQWRCRTVDAGGVALWLSAGLGVLLLATGCATPRGPLFAPLSPGQVWPPPPDPPRIELVGAIGSSADLHAGRSGRENLLKALRGPRPAIPLVGPHGLAVREDDVLAVADSAAAAVHVIDLDARTHLRVIGWQDERFAAPVGVAWVGELLYVTDAKRHEVIVLDEQGAVQRTFGADELTRPVGIAYVPARNEVYVVDGSAHGVVRFRLDGSVAGRFGQRGIELGSFNFPSHIAAGQPGTPAANRIAVADSLNFRVQVLDLDGRCELAFGHKGDGAGDFALPKGVAFDRAGRILVVDAQFENVQIFDDAGRLLLAFGQEGDRLGEFSLPAGIAIGPQERIWVADAQNQRVQVFAYVGT